jgi:hypothetical protein
MNMIFLALPTGLQDSWEKETAGVRKDAVKVMLVATHNDCKNFFMNSLLL